MTFSAELEVEERERMERREARRARREARGEPIDDEDDLDSENDSDYSGTDNEGEDSAADEPSGGGQDKTSIDDDATKNDA